MKNIAKIALLGAVALASSASPAFAQQLLTPGLGGTVLANGTVEVSVFNIGRRTCAVNLVGSVTRSGSSTTTGEVTFTSGTATGTNCTATGTGSTNFPIKIETTLSPTTATKMRITNMSFSTPIGNCTTTNTLVNWSESAQSVTASGVTVGFCTVHNMNLVISPTTPVDVS